MDANGPIPQSIVPKLIAPDGDEKSLPGWEQRVIDGGFRDAKANGTPLVGLILRVVFMNVPVKKLGLFTVKITIDGTDYVGANLKVFTDPSTVSVQPS